MILLLGCSSIGEVTATTSEDISTVVTVSWTTDRPTSGSVRYLDRETPPTPVGTEHTAYLMAPAEESFDFTVVVDGDESAHEAETNALPVGLPAFQVTGRGHKGLMAVPVIGASNAALVLDGEGRIVWYRLEDRDLDVYRARLSVDGTSLLYNAASVSGDPDEDSEIVRVRLDGSKVTPISIPLLAHDFVEHDDGTIAAMVVEYRDGLRGDALLEIAPDGTQTEVWSAWDCWEVDATLEDADQGWTFANALDIDGDGYLLSLRNFSSIARISDRACDWVFGDVGATFGPDAGSASFLHQHQFERFDDRLLVFDNEGLAGSRSRVLEYRLDVDAGTAEEVWRYEPDPAQYSFVLGDVARLEDDTLVTWSAQGRIDRVSDGEPIWTLETPVGSVFGFNTVVP